MALYRYTGPVLVFDKAVIEEVRLVTQAKTEGRAMANFEYRMRQKLGLESNVKIRLIGELAKIREDYA